MRVHRIIRDTDGYAGAPPQAGWVLAHEIERDDATAAPWPKGHVLSSTDLLHLRSAPWRELHLIEPEPGEVHEIEAGQRIAAAAAGLGVEVGALGGGHWPLTASYRGMLRVEVGALTALNDVDGACVYTRLDGQVVDAGTVVARAKAIPLVLSAPAVADAERIARQAGGLVRIAPFRRTTIGVVIQERLDARSASQFTAALSDKIAWFGSDLAPPVFVEPDAVAIAAAIDGVRHAGASVILMAGTKALDPLDPTFVALNRLEMSLDRYGVPMHPGSLFWLAHSGVCAILGVPTCGLFAQLTSFDVILPRVLADQPTDMHALSTLGHGGLLTGHASFFPPYDAARSTKQ